VGVLVGMVFFSLLQLPKSFLRSDSGQPEDVEGSIKVITSITPHVAISNGLDSFMLLEVKDFLYFLIFLRMISQD